MGWQRQHQKEQRDLMKSKDDRIDDLEIALGNLIEESELFLASKMHEEDSFIFEGMVDKWKYLIKENVPNKKSNHPYLEQFKDY